MSRRLATCLALILTLSVTMALALPGTAAANGCPLRVSQGTSGTAADPLRIDTVADLTVLETDSRCYQSNYVFKQTADLALTGVWTPIGPVYAGFTGVYDGGGHAITGLLVDQTAVADYKGLFGKIEGGTVRNLTITGGRIIGVSPAYGVLAGGAGTGSLIENVNIVDSSVSSRGVGSQFMGGVVGIMDGGTIRNTHVSGLSIAIAVTNDNIGGLVGYILRATTIERSSADVSISGTGRYVGGLVGFTYNGGTITDSFARGTVAGSYAVAGLVGGFTGPGSGPITRSYSTVRVVSTGSQGGLVARDSSPAANPAVASFWDTVTSGQATSVNGAIGKTTAELTTMSTFADAGWSIAAGWDATKTWGICPRVNNGYPFLTNAYAAVPTACVDSSPATSTATTTTTPAAASTTLPTRNGRVVGNSITTQVTLPSAGTVVQTGGVEEARAGFPDDDAKEYHLRSTLMVACSTKRTVTSARVLTLHCALNARTLRLITKHEVVIRVITTFTPTTGAKLSSSTAVALPKRAAKPSGSGANAPVTG